jgi:hypothetical protein
MRGTMRQLAKQLEQEWFGGRQAGRQVELDLKHTEQRPGYCPGCYAAPDEDIKTETSDLGDARDLEKRCLNCETVWNERWDLTKVTGMKTPSAKRLQRLLDMGDRAPWIRPSSPVGKALHDMKAKAPK